MRNVTKLIFNVNKTSSQTLFWKIDYNKWKNNSLTLSK